MRYAQYVFDFYVTATGKEHPRICLIPTALADEVGDISAFVNTFEALGADVDVMALMREPLQETTPFELLDRADAFYITGGFWTHLQTLRSRGLFDPLRRAITHQGKAASTTSSGTMLLFENSVSGAIHREPVSGIGVLPGSVVVHANNKEFLMPMEQQIALGTYPDGLAIPEGVVVRFVNGGIVEVVAFPSGPRDNTAELPDLNTAYFMERDGGKTVLRDVRSLVISSSRVRPRAGTVIQKDIWRPRAGGSPFIEVANVKFPSRFSAETNGVSFVLRPDCINVVVGDDREMEPIISSLRGTSRHSSGRITMNGVDIDTLDLMSSPDVAYVEEMTMWTPEQLRMKHRENPSLIEAALDHFGLSEFDQQQLLLHGTAAIPLASLRQVFAGMPALTQRASLLIINEHLTGVRLGHNPAITSCLQMIAAAGTTIVVFPDPNLTSTGGWITAAQHVVHLDYKSELVAQGPPELVFAPIDTRTSAVEPHSTAAWRLRHLTPSDMTLLVPKLAQHLDAAGRPIAPGMKWLRVPGGMDAIRDYDLMRARYMPRFPGCANKNPHTWPIEELRAFLLMDHAATKGEIAPLDPTTQLIVMRNWMTSQGYGATPYNSLPEDVRQRANVFTADVIEGGRARKLPYDLFAERYKLAEIMADLSKNGVVVRGAEQTFPLSGSVTFGSKLELYR